MEGNRDNQAQPAKYSTGKLQKILNNGSLYQKCNLLLWRCYLTLLKVSCWLLSIKFKVRMTVLAH